MKNLGRKANLPRFPFCAGSFRYIKSMPGVHFMSIQLQEKTLGQLRQECDRLGIPVFIKGVRERKSDYIRALRDRQMRKRFGQAIPEAYQLLRHIDSPMLCARYGDCAEEFQEAVWEDSNYIMEEKLRGVRAMLMWTGDGKYPHCFSRFLDSRTYLPRDFQPWIVWKSPVVDGLSRQHSHWCVLDVELICPTGVAYSAHTRLYGEQALEYLFSLSPEESRQRQVRENTPIVVAPIDCLWYRGEWVTEHPLRSRLAFVQEVVSELRSSGISNLYTPQSTIVGKREFYSHLIDNGVEGVVAKPLDSPYMTTGSRSQQGWVKIKPPFTAYSHVPTLVGEDTVDAFVSGYRISHRDIALEMSVLVKDRDGITLPKFLATISYPEDLPSVERDSMGNPVLHPAVYGRVAELQLFRSSSVDDSISAMFIQWKCDRTAYHCVCDQPSIVSHLCR
jgi:hypothetical protein